jgi:hypothetical protein
MGIESVPQGAAWVKPIEKTDWTGSARRAAVAQMRALRL